QSFQGRQRAALIAAHQAGVTDHVRRHDRGQPALLARQSDDSSRFRLGTQTLNAAFLARARMRAREKSLKNFRLVPLRRRYVQRCGALAVIMPIMPTSELVWLVRQ